MRKLALALALLIPAGEKAPDFTLPDVQGKSHTLYALKDRKAVAILFLGIECPRSRAAEPRLCEMAKKYEPQGVTFLAVNSNRNESAAEIADHARQTAFTIPVLKDEKGKVAALYGVEVEPTAILLGADFTVRYRGAIDDHKLEEFVRKPWLRDAIESVLAGRAVETPATEALGCSIKKDEAAPKTGEVTYAKHVAPILFKNCVACHRPGQVGPFSLETYEQASAWSREIARAAKARQMPPWRAATNIGLYHDERRLADGEIAVLEKWHKAGAPPGEGTAPRPPKFPEDWGLGKPDLVLKGDAGHALEARGRDEYRCYVIKNPFNEDRHIAGIDYRPGNMRAVHHLALFLDAFGLSEKKDAQDPGPGYAAAGTSPGVPTTGLLGGWVPGNMPRLLPAGTGRVWKKGERLILHTHYHKTGRPEKDEGTQIAFYFAKGPSPAPIRLQPIANLTFKIPPGAEAHRVTATWTLTRPARVLDVWPHMHLIGREMSVTAALPDGSKKDLVVIRDWSFEWQETYQFRTPVALPAGTRIDVEAVYDNSLRNPNNPSNPPRLVGYGEQTTDEMCAAAVSVVYDK